MTVKPEHKLCLVNVGQKVRIHSKTFAGKWGIVTGKTLPSSDHPDFLAYRIRFTPPLPGMPPEWMFWRFEFEVA